MSPILQTINNLTEICKQLIEEVKLLNKTIRQLEYRIYRCECGTPMHPRKPENTNE